VTGFVPVALPVSVAVPVVWQLPPDGDPVFVRLAEWALVAPHSVHVTASNGTAATLSMQLLSEYSVAVGLQVGSVATPHEHAVQVEVSSIAA
jgi:hypothetical protein